MKKDLLQNAKNYTAETSAYNPAPEYNPEGEYV